MFQVYVATYMVALIRFPIDYCEIRDQEEATWDKNVIVFFFKGNSCFIARSVTLTG